MPLLSARLRAVVVAAGVLLLIALVPTAWVQSAGQARVRTPGDDLPDVVIVLGAGLRPDGTPSTFLRRRLDAAAELYAAGSVQAVLVTGDNSRADYDEPTAMRDWLLERGVPENRIVRDYAGFDTHDSCVRARQVFGVTEAVVITQDYHLNRALFSCSRAGVEAVGIGVSAADVEPRKAAWFRVRELLASAKAAWDAVVGRPPVFLGPDEPGIRDALEDARGT